MFTEDIKKKGLFRLWKVFFKKKYLKEQDIKCKQEKFKIGCKYSEKDFNSN